MNRTMMALATVSLLLAGCGVAQDQTKTTEPITLTTGTAPASRTVTFFANQFHPDAQVSLQPDALVQKEFPGVTAPKETVTVYLPVYPGATPAKSNDNISDMGTPLTPDLVDGTLYFMSADSASKIQSWYEQELKKLDYRQTGTGRSAVKGKTVSTYFAYSKNGSPGSPTQSPDINLGFFQQGNTTLFKLKTSYIVTPVRPKDSYLPTDIQKVVLSNGRRSTTITDAVWIGSVVKQINMLQMSTMGIHSNPGMLIRPGETPPTDIAADFYDAAGASMIVKFSYPTGGYDVVIGKNHLTTTAELNQAIQSAFGT